MLFLPEEDPLGPNCMKFCALKECPDYSLMSIRPHCLCVGVLGVPTSWVGLIYTFAKKVVCELHRCLACMIIHAPWNKASRASRWLGTYELAGLTLVFIWLKLNKWLRSRSCIPFRSHFLTRPWAQQVQSQKVKKYLFVKVVHFWSYQINCYRHASKPYTANSRQHSVWSSF